MVVGTAVAVVVAVAVAAGSVEIALHPNRMLTILERKFAADITFNPWLLLAFGCTMNVVRDSFKKALNRQIWGVDMLEQVPGVQTVDTFNSIVRYAARARGKRDQCSGWRVNL